MIGGVAECVEPVIEDWDVPDPALMTRRQGRRLRYDVAHRVLRLLDELLPGFKPHVSFER